MADQLPFLRVAGQELVDEAGRVVRLTGVGLGGWMNMENFITGYAASEELMRRSVRAVLGAERYELFFERLLTSFFTDEDAALLAGLGMNCVRIPVNYRHFEDDDAPFEIKEEGFRHLDRVIDVCARHGIYTIIDLHALPGAQNHHWHSDNPTHLPFFWDHPHFQDRVANLWRVFAQRYAGAGHVAGYNPINEPADSRGGERLKRFYKRLVDVIRAEDPRHVLFLDGNTYSTEFDMFDEPWENVVYTCHDYALAGFVRGGPYPGYTDGVWVDKEQLEQKFLERTSYSRETNTPIWVGEFGPVYTGDPARDEQRYQILVDQLEIFGRYGASWSIWTYKDVGLQGLVHTSAAGAYNQRFGAFMAKKDRLGADSWGSTDAGVFEVTEPVQQLIAKEFPDYNPYPFGARSYVNELLRHILIAQPLVEDYAGLFAGLGEDELIALADSFLLKNCVRRERLLDTLRS